MKAKAFFTALLAASLSGAAVAQPPKTKTKALTPGSYTAKVKSLPCGACGPKVKDTLQKAEGLKDVTINQETSTVQFTVSKPGVKLDRLQTALKASADEMGMGADYTLTDVTPVKKTN